MAFRKLYVVEGFLIQIGPCLIDHVARRVGHLHKGQILQAVGEGGGQGLLVDVNLSALHGAGHPVDAGDDHEVEIVKGGAAKCSLLALK